MFDDLWRDVAEELDIPELESQFEVFCCIMLLFPVVLLFPLLTVSLWFTPLCSDSSRINYKITFYPTLSRLCGVFKKKIPNILDTVFFGLPWFEITDADADRTLIFGWSGTKSQGLSYTIGFTFDKGSGFVWDEGWLLECCSDFVIALVVVKISDFDCNGTASLGDGGLSVIFLKNVSCSNELNGSRDGCFCCIVVWLLVKGRGGNDIGCCIVSSIGVVVSFSGTVAKALGLIPENADVCLGGGSKWVRPAFTNIDAVFGDESCKMIW